MPVPFSLIFARILSVVGIVLFGAALYLTFSVPGWLENFASSYIEEKLAEKIDLSIDRIAPPSREGLLGDLARKAYEANESKIEAVKAQLRSKAHEAMADALAQIRDLDCECRAKYVDHFKRGFEFDLSLLQSANDKIFGTIQSGYLGVVADLKRDIRIFTSSNIAIFALLLLATFLKPNARAHLIIPAALLTASTLICSYFYVFEQNWLMTIIHSDYVGYAYLGYLAVVSFFLADIIFNRARVTTELINAFFNAIGSAISVVPC